MEGGLCYCGVRRLPSLCICFRQLLPGRQALDSTAAPSPSRSWMKVRLLPPPLLRVLVCLQVGLGRVLMDGLGLETVVRINSPVQVGRLAGCMAMFAAPAEAAAWLHSRTKCVRLSCSSRAFHPPDDSSMLPPCTPLAARRPAGGQVLAHGREDGHVAAGRCAPRSPAPLRHPQ